MLTSSDPNALYANPEPPETILIEASPEPVPQSESVPDQPPEEPVVFSPKSREDLEGLLYLGHLMKTFRWAEHTFTIRTLRVEDHLEISQTIQQWRGQSGQELSWEAACAAACVVSVDGKQIPGLPVIENETSLGVRFRWACRQYPWTISAIWEELILLEDRVREELNAMGKAPGGP